MYVIINQIIKVILKFVCMLYPVLPLTVTWLEKIQHEQLKCIFLLLLFPPNRRRGGGGAEGQIAFGADLVGIGVCVASCLHS